ncbi:CBS domain protein [Leptospira yanagawae serovar Saopaulo str. Sao Paulo = ATCC 700523]|uniref:CBS domain protein n=1 Tax=Leptospira yanagawae serovar Saopaulo str. Sao Paulo = ATCC 700523 TaxID=1249483 RepID=A0A5E8HCY4_9LEPT|nr:CBS domain-containing protein [Leptospira yanagawae]EOQ88420.1 CBS domain protein [Leptospira yanagawae serovar Saopaulo str. Sao Paulo = ATCC 700523]
MFFWIHDGRISPNPPLTHPDRVPKIHPTSQSTPSAIGEGEPDTSPTGSFLHRNPKEVYKEASLPTEKPVFFLHEMMTSPVYTKEKEDSVETCLDFMLEKGIRHLPITGKMGELVGFVSDRDLLDKTKSYEREMPVSDIMTKRVLVGSPGAEIRQVTKVLLEERIGCLPIVNDDNVPIGIITRSDLLRLLLKYPNLSLTV